MSKPKDYSWMTKDKLMTYTFFALLAIAIITAVLWSPVTPFDPVSNAQYMNLGLTVAINCLIAVAIAVGVDALLYKVASDSPLNTMSAAVFGLIVALSYTLGVPAMASAEESMLPLVAPQCFVYVGLIALIGMVVFKKIQGLAGRKFVNPAAMAKLIVLLPFLYVVFVPKDHTTDIPTLATKLDTTVPHHSALGCDSALATQTKFTQSPKLAFHPTLQQTFSMYYSLTSSTAGQVALLPLQSSSSVSPSSLLPADT